MWSLLFSVWFTSLSIVPRGFLMSHSIEPRDICKASSDSPWGTFLKIWGCKCTLGPGAAGSPSHHAWQRTETLSRHFPMGDCSEWTGNTQGIATSAPGCACHWERARSLHPPSCLLNAQWCNAPNLWSRWFSFSVYYEENIWFFFALFHCTAIISSYSFPLVSSNPLKMILLCPTMIVNHSHNCFSF